MSQHSIMVSDAAYRAARAAAASIDRSDRGRLAVRGPDRASYLQGLLTNDIAALAPGRGCYAAYLTPQGRMISDMLVYEVGDFILLTLPPATANALQPRLDRLIFTEDVTVEDISGAYDQRAVVGPRAAEVLASILDETSLPIASLPEHGALRTMFGGEPAIIAQVTDTGEPGFDVYVTRAQAASFRAKLESCDVVEIDRDTAEAIRIEAGIPGFGQDMTDETIPLEAGIEARAISFTKGCYVGQEVIVRVLHRGHGRVARKLVGLTFDAETPPPTGGVVTA